MRGEVEGGRKETEWVGGREEGAREMGPYDWQQPFSHVTGAVVVVSSTNSSSGSIGSGSSSRVVCHLPSPLLTVSSVLSAFLNKVLARLNLAAFFFSKYSLNK